MVSMKELVKMIKVMMLSCLFGFSHMLGEMLGAYFFNKTYITPVIIVFTPVLVVLIITLANKIILPIHYLSLGLGLGGLLGIARGITYGIIFEKRGDYFLLVILISMIAEVFLVFFLISDP